MSNLVLCIPVIHITGFSLHLKLLQYVYFKINSFTFYQAGTYPHMYRILPSAKIVRLGICFLGLP